MPRHTSVPDHLGSILLGRVSTDTGTIVIIAPEMAGLFGDKWTAQYIGEDGEQLVPPQMTMPDEGEIEVGDNDVATLISVFADGAYIIEGRMADTGDGAELSEIRIRLWTCQ